MNPNHTTSLVAGTSGDVSRTIHLTPIAADVRRRIPPSAMSSASSRRRLPLLDRHTSPSRVAGWCLATIAAALLLLPAVAKAAAFTSGSTGAYGAMNITADTTLNLPTNGIFHCTTINIDPGVTLRFNRNPLNTPVYLLATGDVTIKGIIDVSGGGPSGGAPGLGGPGGFDGGFGGFGISPNNIGGDGKGPGGGKRVANTDFLGYLVSGAFGGSAAYNTNSYGNALLVPLIGGSGASGSDGNPGLGGGGGGGAILVASTTKIELTGAIRATGGNYGGSGGAIRLLSPLVTGNGTADTGGAGFPSLGYPYYNWVASAGRVRIDCLDRYAFRSLAMPGYATRGTQMIVFPPVIPRLDITQAAGTTIPLNTNGPVTINLVAGANPTNTVTIRAQDFTNSVPIRVVLTPENGASISYDITLNMTSNPAQTNVTVVFPIGVPTRVDAWTR